MKQQEYMDKVYEYWQAHGTLTRKEVCKHFGYAYTAAVMMGNFHYQVCNGGVSQWAGNGYMSEDIEDLILLFRKAVALGISGADSILDILQRILNSAGGNADILNAPSYSEYETCFECSGSGEAVDYCSDCDGEGCDECDEGEIGIVCEECGGSGEFEQEFSPFSDEFCDNVATIDNDYYAIDNALVIYQSILDRIKAVEVREPEITDVIIKPKCKLSGHDSNIFNLMGIASAAMKKEKIDSTKIEEMCGKVTSSDSFDEALAVIMEYVDVS